MKSIAGLIGRKSDFFDRFGVTFFRALVSLICVGALGRTRVKCSTIGPIRTADAGIISSFWPLIRTPSERNSAMSAPCVDAKVFLSNLLAKVLL
jgi:hypothetical protein